MNPNRLFKLAVTMTLLAAGAGAPALAETATPAPQTAPQTVLPTITVAAVTRGPMRDIVPASGLVSAEETVLVQPQIEGQAIDSLAADVGDDVAAGAVLAVLSDSTLLLQKSQLAASRAAAQAGIAQAGAQMTEATAAADEADRVAGRAAVLRAQGNASQAQTDQAAAAATSARAKVTAATEAMAAAGAQRDLIDAQIANLDLQLARTQVKAPVSGRIVGRNAMVGAIASGAGQAMFTIVRDGRLELRADVTEADLARLAPGQTASLRLVGVEVPVTGTVRLIDPAINAATRLGTVRIRIDDAAIPLRTGMFAQADVLVAARDTLSIPVTAVGGDADGTVAMLVRDGVVRRTPVVTGIRDGDRVEIVSGLFSGDQVVLRAGAFVRDGDHVNPVAETAAVTN